MSKNKLLLERYPVTNDKQTEGQLTVLSEAGHIVYKCFCLELPDKDNQFQVSRIPAGDYKVAKRFSKKYNNHFHILDVPNRSMILIHHGNYYTQTLGCILVGDKFEYLNKDRLKDVMNSVATMKQLVDLLPNEFTISIQELKGVEL